MQRMVPIDPMDQTDPKTKESRVEFFNLDPIVSILHYFSLP